MIPNRTHRPRVAVFDFDGTVSLIREGWSRLMAHVGRDVLLKQNLKCDESQILKFEDQMLRLSGRPSMIQMQKLADELKLLGATPPTAEQLHDDFLSRLYTQIDQRKKDLANGSVKPNSWTVPGTHELLNELRNRKIELYLVSGTDRESVVEESALLKLTDYFGTRVFAPTADTPGFHKRDAFTQIIAEQKIQPQEMISFGDGFSETVEAKKIGSCAVGVASVEVGKTGPNLHKMQLLSEWGADPIIPDYSRTDVLLTQLVGE